MNLPTLLITGIKMAVIRALLTIVALITSIVLTRGLGAQGYGVYVYALSVMALLATIGQLGIPALISREATRTKEQNTWSSFRAMFVYASRTVIILSISIALIAFAGLWFFFEQLPSDIRHTYIWLLLLLPFMIFMRLLSATLHGFHHIIVNKIMSEFVPAVSFMVVISGLFFLFPETHSPQYVAFMKWLVGVIATALVLFVLWHKSDKKFWQDDMRDDIRNDIRGDIIDASKYSKEPYMSHKELLRKALPFTLIAGAGILYSQIDIFMLGFFRSSSEVGIYSIATKISVFVLLALQIINSFVGPQMVKMYAQKNMPQLQKLVTISSRIAFVFALLVCSVLWIFGKQLIDIIFGEAFILAYTPLSILVAGKLFAATMGSVGLLAQSSYNEKYVMRIVWFNALLNIVLNLIFIPLWGMTGAAISTAVCITTYNLFMHHISRTKIGVDPSIF